MDGRLKEKLGLFDHGTGQLQLSGRSKTSHLKGFLFILLKESAKKRVFNSFHKKPR